jgi:phosphate transport system protein
MPNGAPKPIEAHSKILELTSTAIETAHAAASAAAEGIAASSTDILEVLRSREAELDRLDYEVDELVTVSITSVKDDQARELLACLKFVIGLERIGDLLLSFANRASTVARRLEIQDTKDLTMMASRLEKMIADADKAFTSRNLDMAVAVLRADGELDRLRNLIVLRHLEHPGSGHYNESFHVLFMAQSLERAGDHVKNIAEEVCHLVSGHTVRHVLRTYDKPIEQMFLDKIRSSSKRA